ncbi:hypothetical protein JR338_09660 [Chloroflexota bacterium]|nr:hypothetical protein JR338_09660 [Chloroflexota bacterium]
MIAFDGWLLDLFEDENEGIVLYFMDRKGPRWRLTTPFPVTFYAQGDPEQLRALWRYLRGLPQVSKIDRTERMDVFRRQWVPVLAATVQNPVALSRLIQNVVARFPELEYSDADISITVRFAAQTGATPLSYCHVTADEETHELTGIEVLEDAWVMTPQPIPFRSLFLSPSGDPNHGRPRYLRVIYGKRENRYLLSDMQNVLVCLRATLKRVDPDLIITEWGDTWLLPLLLEKSQEYQIPLKFNRETGRDVLLKKELTYFSYGQIIYRGQQVHLFGRCHLDRRNAMLWSDYDMDGTIESCRVTSLPLQVAARVSPGTGISSIEMLTALRQQVLVPYQKQQAEFFKPVADLYSADQGGIVYQPLIGLHRNVGMVDFTSMYPAVMVYFNLSPETILPNGMGGTPVPALGITIDNSQEGLVPKALRPLLEKRIALKKRLAMQKVWYPPDRERIEHRASALKWLLVVCFGYLGYKNARFGRIEAHQAVTAYGREAMMQAKEAAEDMGCEVIQMYVDGLWVQHPDWSQPADFEALLLEIEDRTGLPIALDGVYRWIVFVGSRGNKARPVANRYFGVFQDGSIKVRGIDARRRDATPFVKETQLHLLELLAKHVDPFDGLPSAVKYLRGQVRKLRSGKVPLADLLVKQRLGRKLEAYRTLSPAARAAFQLKAVGKEQRPGQRVAFLFTLGKPGVHAWDLPERPDPESVDLARYEALLIRSAGIVLEAFGLDEKELTRLMKTDLKQLGIPQLRQSRL